MVPKTWKIEVWRGSGSSWGRPWNEKSLKSWPGRFWSILAGLGSTKMLPKWPKMAPSWAQDGAKMLQVVAKMAILRAFGELSWAFLVVLGAIYWQMAKVENRTTVQRFCYILGSWGLWLEALGEYFGRSWPQVGLTWAILASNWELFGNMLGLRWPKMAQDGQPEWKKWMRYAQRCTLPEAFGRARRTP